MFSTGLFSCLKQLPTVPSEYIQPDEFTGIMLDIRIAEAYQKVLRQKGQNSEHFIDSAYQQIYYQHGVSEAEVNHSYEFYLDHPEWMEKISSDVIERLNRLEQ